jgi:class 3 adenylate cyclase
MERRLAAILAADVAGYSRLMGPDEEGTLALGSRGSAKAEVLHQGIRTSCHAIAS